MKSKPRPKPRRAGLNGGQLVSGLHGGNQGGRPKDEFYQWLRSVVYDPVVRQRYADILLRSRDPELFLKALKWGDERLHGKPSQPFTATNDDGDEIAFRLKLA